MVAAVGLLVPAGWAVVRTASGLMETQGEDPESALLGLRLGMSYNFV